jgi:hypothetical protein
MLLAEETGLTAAPSGRRYLRIFTEVNSVKMNPIGKRFVFQTFPLAWHV